MANILSFTEVIKIDSLVYKMYASHENKYLNLLSNIILHQVVLQVCTIYIHSKIFTQEELKSMKIIIFLHKLSVSSVSIFFSISALVLDFSFTQFKCFVSLRLI